MHPSILPSSPPKHAPMHGEQSYFHALLAAESYLGWACSLSVALQSLYVELQVAEGVGVRGVEKQQ